MHFGAEYQIFMLLLLFRTNLIPHNLSLIVKCMKPKFLIVIIAALISLCANSAAAIDKGEFAVGAKLGYISKNESAVAGVRLTYALTEDLRIAPEIGGVFRNDHQDAFTADFNLHFPFSFGTDRVALYPLVGLNYTAWTHHNEYITGAVPEDDCYKRFGLNAGAGLDLKCNSKIKLFVEAKYCLIKTYSSAQIAIGAAYIF
jgi:opacity protein-like surface antigen